MADTNDYLDGLSEDDLATLEAATSNQDTILSGKGADADALSGLIANAPVIGTNVTIYRYYDDSNFEAGEPLYSFTEPGFIVGSGTQPPVKPGAAIFGFKLPSGVQAIPLPDGSYILDRGLTVYFTPSPTDVVPATVAEAFKNGKALVAGGVRAEVRFNTGYIPTQDVIDTFEGESLEEFYNHAHGRGGKFTSGGGSSGGSGGGNQGNRPQGGGNQGQHRAGGQSNQGQHRPGGGQTPQGKFIGVHHGGNRPPQQGNKPGFQGKPKISKPEEHLHRTANVVRSVVAIATVVVTVAAIVNAVSNLSDTKGNKVQRQANKARNQETIRKSKPQFKSKEDEAAFNWLNPTGKFVRPNPERIAREGQRVTNIS